MADQDKTPHFETDDVEANLAIEQGLGVGARELAAQREPGGIITPDEDEVDDADDDGVDVDAKQAAAKAEEEQLSRTSDA